MTTLAASAGWPAGGMGRLVRALGAALLGSLAVLVGEPADGDERCRPSATVAATARPGAVTSQAAGGARDRDDAAAAARFASTMLPHLDAAHNLARYLSRDAVAAEDIVQDAYLRAYRSFAGYRGGDARAWILAIVRNCHLSWRGAQGRDGRHASLDEALEDGGEDGALAAAMAEEATPETHLLSQAQSSAVAEVLESLAEPFREVLVLRELEDLSYREIAAVTQTPIGTVMSRLSRARREFRLAWARGGFEGGQS